MTVSGPSEILREGPLVASHERPEPTPTPRINPAGPFLQRALRFLAWGIPLMIVGGLLYDWSFITEGDTMFLSALLASSVAMWAGVVLFRQASDTFSELYERGAINQRPGGGRWPRNPSSLLSSLWLRFRRAPEDGQEEGEQYLRFIQRLDRWLGHWTGVGVGLAFAGGMYGLVWFEVYDRTGRGSLNWLRTYWDMYSFPALAAVITWIVAAFVVGVVAWRVMVLAVFVARLGREFDLHLLVGHPDRSGGLKPLGDLCFNLALMVAIPAIFFAVWVAILSAANPQGEFAELRNRWLGIYRFALLPVFLALVYPVAIRPLVRVHKVMRQQRVDLARQVDHLAERINRSARILLGSNSSDPEQGKKLMDDQKLYEALSDIPAWPFDRRVVLKFAALQTVPILSLTGVSQKLADVLEAVFKGLE